jgi:hypothetical protein
MLLFQQPAILPIKVELAVEGRWHTASRDQLTHRKLTHTPTN